MHHTCIDAQASTEHGPASTQYCAGPHLLVEGGSAAVMENTGEGSILKGWTQSFAIDQLGRGEEGKVDRELSRVWVECRVSEGEGGGRVQK